MIISRKTDYSMYFILESPLCKRDPLFIVSEALRGGAGIVQLRDKDSSYMERLVIGREIKKICNTFGAVFIVNDSDELAVELDADGIHVGKSDLPVADLRNKFPGKLIGYSPVSLEDAVRAESDGADYLGAGPVFETASKSDAGSGKGIDFVRKMTSLVKIPVVGIGGINAQNALYLREAGAAGAAVITAISMSDDPYGAAMQIKEIFTSCNV